MDIRKKTKMLIEISDSTAYCCDIYDVDKLLKFISDDNVFELTRDTNRKWKRVNRLRDDYVLTITAIDDSIYQTLSQGDLIGDID